MEIAIIYEGVDQDGVRGDELRNVGRFRISYESLPFSSRASQYCTVLYIVIVRSILVGRSKINLYSTVQYRNRNHPLPFPPLQTPFTSSGFALRSLYLHLHLHHHFRCSRIPAVHVSLVPFLDPQKKKGLFEEEKEKSDLVLAGSWHRCAQPLPRYGCRYQSRYRYKSRYKFKHSYRTVT